MLRSNTKTIPQPVSETTVGFVFALAWLVTTSRASELEIPIVVDDGNAIAFAARKLINGQPVTGIYVANPESGEYTKVIAPGDGVLDPGETHNDTNLDGFVDLGEDVGPVVNIDVNANLGVNGFSSGDNSLYQIAFLAQAEDGSQDGEDPPYDDGM